MLFASALAGAEPSSIASAAATPERELPPLPPIPKLELAPPAQSEIEDVQARLERLRSEKLDERREAVRDVLEVPAKSMAAILGRLDKLAGRADRDRMKRAMLQAKDKSGRDTEDADEPATAKARQDLLTLLVERARPKDEGWRDLVELVALSRMLTQIGNVYAARGLIEIYVRFGEFMRVDVQNRLADLRDGAIAALIEARRHKAEKIARWAERQLDRLGKAVPSEAIRTDNFEVLADVLRAYGRTRDPDAARIVVSYASSERFQIREAARQAIAMLGEVGLWQLREAYENVVGKRARRDWSWDRTARELFFEYDRLHAKKTYDLLDEGTKAASEHRYDEMAKAYDAILSRTPQFDRANSLAPGYFAYAQEVAHKQPDAAEAALVRAERVTDDPALRQRARSLRDTIRAEQQLKAGVLDTYRLQSAADLDPSNARAKQLLSSGDREAITKETKRLRWMTSGAVALIGFCAILFVLLRGRKRLLDVTEQQNADAATTNVPPTDDSNDASKRGAPEISASLAGVSTSSEREALEAASEPSDRLTAADTAARSLASDADQVGLDGAVSARDLGSPREPEPEPVPPKRRDPFDDY